MQSDQITDEIFDFFCDFYNNFAKQKNFKRGCDRNLLQLSKDTKNLILTFGKDDQNNILVAHAYLVGDGYCRLWYSCSLYRDNNADRALVRRANRCLHWVDMCKFKELNYDFYDWGGVSERDEIKNITAFKKEFGGYPQTLYDYQITKTLKGKFYNLVCKLLNR